MKKWRLTAPAMIWQAFGFIFLMMIFFTIIVCMRLYDMKEEMKGIKSLDPPEVEIEYKYTPTEGYEIVDGIMPDDIYELDDFNKAACMIAQTLYGESRGLSMYEQSCVVWTILNRLDSGRYGSDIPSIIAAPNQFIGYKDSNPIDGDLYNLAVDVMMRWEYESYSQGSVGRTLPKEYTGFYGKNGHNWFRNSEGKIFDFSSEDPYGDKGVIE